MRTSAVALFQVLVIKLTVLVMVRFIVAFSLLALSVRGPRRELACRSPAT
jgi:hypothetical protein